jgi:hypothetical protein
MDVNHVLLGFIPTLLIRPRVIHVSPDHTLGKVQIYVLLVLLDIMQKQTDRVVVLTVQKTIIQLIQPLVLNAQILLKISEPLLYAFAHLVII